MNPKQTNEIQADYKIFHEEKIKQLLQTIEIIIGVPLTHIQKIQLTAVLASYLKKDIWPLQTGYQQSIKFED
jgi:hypothetical protein